MISDQVVEVLCDIKIDSTKRWKFLKYFNGSASAGESTTVQMILNK